MQEFPPLCGPHCDMIVDTEDMSYETFSYPVQEFPSSVDPHSGMRLDIDDMSYEASIACII